MDPDRLITVRVRIFGQDLDLRVETGTEEQVKRVASVVDARIRERRSQGANSDLRASIMSAFEFAHELDDHHVDLAKFRNVSDKSLGSTSARIDRLLANLDREVGGSRENAPPPPHSEKAKQPDRQQEKTGADAPQAPRPPVNPAREARNAALAALRSQARPEQQAAPGQPPRQAAAEEAPGTPRFRPPRPVAESNLPEHSAQPPTREPDVDAPPPRRPPSPPPDRS